MKFAKSFSNYLDPVVRLVILFIFLGFGAYRGIDNAFQFNFSFLRQIEDLMPVVLIVCGIVVLALKKKELAAHLTLLFGMYLAGASGFINSLLSFRLKPFGFVIPLSFETIFYFIGFIYLALMIISLYDHEKPQFKKQGQGLLRVIVLMFFFIWIAASFSVAISEITLALISLYLGLPLATLLFMGASFIDVPFGFLDTLINTNLLSIRVSTYLYAAISFYFLYIIGKKAWPLILKFIEKDEVVVIDAEVEEE